MMCPRLKRVSITTDIPADEVHDEQLRRITKFAGRSRSLCGFKGREVVVPNVNRLFFDDRCVHLVFLVPLCDGFSHLLPEERTPV